jgi:SAM-dependent methyltransferase
MKLNLGSGIRPKEGYVNVDVVDHPAVDQVVDLNKLPWPWEDNSIEEIQAIDVLEHLAPLGRVQGQLNIIAVMGEIHRVLKPDGVLEAMVASTDSPAAFQDPMKVTFWNRNTFLHFIWPGPYWKSRAELPKFTLEAEDCGLADSDVNEYGMVWAVARIVKLSEEKEAEIRNKMAELDAEIGSAAAEGADFNG